MMRVLLSTFALAVLACSLHAQDPGTTRNVPEAAHHETIRRGDYLEELGSTQAGPEQISVSALAPPEDDSDRWFVNVIVTDDPHFKKDCDRLVADWTSSIDLHAWGDPDNPKGSWGHLDFKNIDSPKLKDWFAGIRPALEGKPFPAIHLQPPLNRKFGRNAITVGIIHGYNGDAKYLSQRIQAKVKDYADKVAASQLVSAAASFSDRFGHSQYQPAGDRGPAPTVEVPSRNPVEWPELKPPAPKTLAYKQVRTLCPEAPASFVRSLVKEGVTTEDEVAEAYDEYLEGSEAKHEPENPTQATSSSLDGLIVAGIGIAIVVGVILIVRRQQGQPSCNTKPTNGTNTNNG